MARAILKRVEIENFKSYRGSHHIGPFKAFTAVIGENGEGKSNLMDALSFVMGEKTQTLRVKRLSDLVHTGPDGNPVSQHALVRAIFEVGDLETTFERMVQNSSSVNRVNGKLVTLSDYHKELEGIGVNVRAQNFLIFQGTVEDVSLRTGKERTALFEELSGSGALKEEYEDFKTQQAEAQQNHSFAFQKMKSVAAEESEARHEKDEAAEYSKSCKKLHDRRLKLYLLSLNRIEKEMEVCRHNLDKETTLQVKVEQKIKRAEEDLVQKKEEKMMIISVLADTAKKIRAADLEVKQENLAYVKTKESLTHVEKKLGAAEQNLEQARKAMDAHNKEIDGLNKDLEQVEEEKRAYENELASKGRYQGSDIDMNAKEEEYRKLKEQVVLGSAEYLEDLDCLNHELKSDRDRLDNKLRVYNEIKSQLERRSLELRDMAHRKVVVEEKINAIANELNKIREDLNRSEAEDGDSKKTISELEGEEKEIQERLKITRIDKYEFEHFERKKEVVEKLKELVVGVYGRFTDMCHPTHPDYNKAVTKVVGKYMDAIIVDGTETGKRCIQYLKDRMLRRETFLPLSSLRAKPRNARLANIVVPPNVRLLYDVLKFHNADIEKAVLFITNNALVCENEEDAMVVARDADGTLRNVVTLSGTFYRKSGFISGGAEDLGKKGAAWDVELHNHLKEREKRVASALRTAREESREEHGLILMKDKIKAFESRLHYAQVDRENTANQERQLQEEISSIEENLEQERHGLEEVKARTRDRTQQVDEVKRKLDGIKDNIFSAFCEEIGVSDIGQYEEREMRTRQEQQKRFLSYDEQINRISNRLKFEKSRNARANVARWEKYVSDGKSELEKARQLDRVQSAKLAEKEQVLRSLIAEKKSSKEDFENMDEEIAKIRRHVVDLTKDLESYEKKFNSIEIEIRKKKFERHIILKQAKMNGVVVPMTRGSMEDVEEDVIESLADLSEVTSGDTNTLTFDNEDRIEVDYSQVPVDDLETVADMREEEERLQRKVDLLDAEIKQKQVPNMNAEEKLNSIRERLREVKENERLTLRALTDARKRFERVKKARAELFKECFDHVAEVIDRTYKLLTGDERSIAVLSAMNENGELFDGVISYCCLVPGKQCIPMNDLSGGERTMASLALLFAMRSYRPSPFFVLDEIDAALDTKNCAKVVNFLIERSASVQTIAISLKETLYCRADTIVGVFSSDIDGITSNTLMFDASEYPLVSSECSLATTDYSMITADCSLAVSEL